MAKLLRAASGERHLRWSKEVHATMEAHLRMNPDLSPTQRDALRAEWEVLGERITGLSAAVLPYRAFVEGAYTQVRAKQRVGNFLCDEVAREVDGTLRHKRADLQRALPGAWEQMFAGQPLSHALRQGHERTAQMMTAMVGVLGSVALPGVDLEGLAQRAASRGALLDEANRELALEIDPQRAPLRLAVERAIFALREHLEQSDGRLRTHFPSAFIDSLYPELGSARTHVLDDADEDDDNSAQA
jgi:hypothetical protein